MSNSYTFQYNSNVVGEKRNNYIEIEKQQLNVSIWNYLPEDILVSDFPCNSLMINAITAFQCNYIDWFLLLCFTSHMPLIVYEKPIYIIYMYLLNTLKQ